MSKIIRNRAGGIGRLAHAGTVTLCCAFFLANPAEAPAADSDGFFHETEISSNHIVRLHVLAHSSHPADQQIKYRVVEQVMLFLNELETPVEGDLLAQLDHCLPELEEELHNFTDRGMVHMPVNVTLTRELFPMKVYERMVYPAGEYHVLKVVIGEGDGENWWCLLFPSLCLPLAERDKPPTQEAGTAEIKETIRWEEEQIGENNLFSFVIWDWLCELLKKN